MMVPGLLNREGVDFLARYRQSPSPVALHTDVTQDGRVHFQQLVNFTVLIIAVASTLYFFFLMAVRSAVPKSDMCRQDFGDQMAEEGEVGNVWKSTAAVYSFLAAYAALTAVITGCNLATVPVYYALAMVAFYGWHYASHLYHGAMRDVHMRHHKQDFSFDDFYGDTSGAIEQQFVAPPTTLVTLINPANSMTLELAHEGPLALAGLAILAAGRALARTSWAALAFVLVGIVFMAVIGSALHTSFHVRNFELEPFAWYRELRALHYLHHMHHVNFAMVNMHVDRVFGSYEVEKRKEDGKEADLRGAVLTDFTSNRSVEPLL